MRNMRGDKQIRKEQDNNNDFMCSVCTETKYACMCTAGVSGCAQVLITLSSSVHLNACLFLYVVYMCVHNCVFIRVHEQWCVWVAVHAHVSCWVYLVDVPHHCSVPSGLRFWPHSLFVCCSAAIHFVFCYVLPHFLLIFSKVVDKRIANCSSYYEFCHHIFYDADNFWP